MSGVPSLMHKSSIVRTLAALLAFSPACLAAQNASAPTTVILVRHAEKMAEPAADPPLTSAGIARGDALWELVKDAGVSAVVTTQFLRTRQTGAAAASKLAITPTIVDARAPQHAKLVADSITQDSVARRCSS